MLFSLKHCFFSTTSRDELFLNLVIEYVKLYAYQGLAYIHTVRGVCHSDVKPQNVLVGRAFGWESSSVFLSRSCCSWPSHCPPSGKIRYMFKGCCLARPSLISQI